VTAGHTLLRSAMAVVTRSCMHCCMCCCALGAAIGKAQAANSVRTAIPTVLGASMLSWCGLRLLC
jgi:hypothetical protein